MGAREQLVSARAGSRSRLPARVYWTRRLAVLAVVLAVVSTAGSLLSRWSSPQGTDSVSAGTPAPLPADAAGAMAAAGTSVGGGGSAGEAVGTLTRTRSERRAAQPVLPPPSARCRADEVSVVPTVVGAAQAGAETALQLQVTSMSDTTCRLPLGERLLVQVSRDGEPAWRLADCPAALSTESVVLYPSWTSVVDVTWSGRTSNATCSVGTRAVRPGAYRLQAAMLGGEPDTTRFEVETADDASVPQRRGRRASDQT